MYRNRKIFFNNNLFEDMIFHEDFNAFAFYYLLKFLFANSKVYNFKINTTFLYLKQLGILPKNFSQSKLKNIIDTLTEYGLAFKNKDNTLLLKSVHSEKGKYISYISANNNISFIKLKELLVLEYLKKQNFSQNKAIEFRNKLTNRPTKHKLNSRQKENLELLGESYSNEILITYRTIAADLNLSYSQIYIAIQNLIKNKLCTFETIVINHNLRVSGNIPQSELKSIFNLNMYSYINSEGWLMSVQGSEFKICN